MAIGVEDPWNRPQCQAAVVLLETLGCDSTPLRLVLAVVDRIDLFQSVVPASFVFFFFFSSRPSRCFIVSIK